MAKSKTSGQNNMEQALLASSSKALPPQVEKSPNKRKEPMDRSSPRAPLARKKVKEAKTTSLDELAAVEGFVETAPPTTIENAKGKEATTTSLDGLPAVEGLEETAPPTTIESAPTTIASSGKGKDAACDNSNSSGKGKDAAGDSSDSSGKGKDAAGDSSDSSGKGKDAAGDTSDSDGSDSDILPTPIKKPSGIDRLQRGRKIKATSPAGRNNPTVPVLIF